MNPDGYVSDEDWLRSTADHIYPDVVSLAYQAVTGLVKNKADVMTFLEDGWVCGSPAMNLWLKFESTHASPMKDSVTGILMSTDQDLPEYVRAKDALDIVGLRDAVNKRIKALGIKMRDGQ